MSINRIQGKADVGGLGVWAAFGLLLAVWGCSSSVDTSPGVAPFSIEGVITKQGVPVPGVTVSFVGQSAPGGVVTDGNGRFRQTGFRAGTYTVQPSDGTHDFYYGGVLTNPSIRPKCWITCSTRRPPHSGEPRSAANA